MIGSGVFMCNIFFTADRFVPSVFLYILLYIPTSLQCKQSFKLVTGTILYFLLVHFVSTVSEINQFYKNTMMCQSNTTNLYYIFSVSGQHVSILIESSSDPSKKIDPYLEGPEDDSIRIETCCPNTIINIIKFCCV